jgi:hypothetical protein
MGSFNDLKVYHNESYDVSIEATAVVIGGALVRLLVQQ